MDTHTENMIPLWVVYHDPLDFPGKFVTRKFLNSMPTNTYFIGDSLEGIRGHIPEGLVKIMPDPDDDKKIVEIWL